MNRYLLSCLLLFGGATGAWGASQPPMGFKVLGSVPHPICGKIGMPADWQEALPENRLGFTPGAADKARGFMVFHKHYMEKTTPYTLPLEHELTTNLKLFAVPGEYEPVTFFLRSLRPLKDIRATVTDLVSKEGKTLESANMELRAAVAIPFRHPVHSQKYVMKNEILVRQESYSLEAERTLQYWLTVYVPKGTAGGRYQGKVVLTVDGQKHELPLLLRVFPAQLEANDQVEIGLFIGRHLNDLAERRKYYLDMREHGMNTMAPCNYSVHPSWKNGRIELDFWALDSELELYREVGFTMPVCIDMRGVQAWLSNLQKEMAAFKKAGKAFPDNYRVPLSSYDISPTFTEFEEVEYKKIVRQMVAHGKKANWPRTYYLPQEESTNKGVRIQQLQRFSKLLKECGVRVTGWSNGTWAGIDDLQDTDSTIDVRYYNFITPKIRQRTKKSGDFFGIYNHGDRLMYGFFGDKSQAEGMLQWAYIWGVPKNFLSNGSGYYGSGLTYPGVGGPLPSPTWEAIREGVDDNRCIFTLKKLIARHRGSRDKALREKARKAQQVLDGIMAQIPDTTKEYSELNKTMDPGQLDVWRFKLIRQIMNLQQQEAKTSQAAVAAKPSRLLAGVTREALEKKTAVKQVRASTSLVVPYAKTVSFNAAMTGDGWARAAETKPFLLTEVLAWQKIRAVASGDIDKVPPTPASQATTARLVYDDQALYVGFRCMESQMSKIVELTTKRDGAVYSDDAIEMFIKPSLNANVYYHIAGNPRGTLLDLKWLWDGQNRQMGNAWNPDIKIKVMKASDRWQIVFRIPFAGFGLSSKPMDGAIWLAQLGREEQPVPGCEYSTWTLVYRSFHELHRWGMLYFNRIPAAVISGILSDAPKMGKNVLNVALANNRQAAFQGSLAIAVRGKGRCASAVPVTLSKAQGQLSIPLEVLGEGPLDLELTLKDRAGASLFSTNCHYDVEVPLMMRPMSTEVAGGKLGVHVTVNLSASVVSQYRLRCRLAGQGTELVDDAALQGSGKHQVYVNMDSLKPGRYALFFQLVDGQGKIIATDQAPVEVLEKIF